MCLRCSGELPTDGHRHARSLCSACYARCYRDGTLEDYPRTQWRREDLVEEYDFLRRHEGLSRAEVAARLGIKRDRLDKAIERTKAAA